MLIAKYNNRLNTVNYDDQGFCGFCVANKEGCYLFHKDNGPATYSNYRGDVRFPFYYVRGICCLDNYFLYTKLLENNRRSNDY